MKKTSRLKSIFRWSLIACVIMGVIFGIALVINPAGLIYTLGSAVGHQQGLVPPVAVTAPSVTWHDDYFTIEHIDARTIAIGEPRFWQKNISYLILGDSLAVLFDSGPCLRDISQVVRSLTPLPVLVMTSHLHYDHIGCHERFDAIGLIGTPALQAQVDENRVFKVDGRQHLGSFEDMKRPEFVVTRWVAHREKINLGGRELEVFETPGHTDDSMMLYDARSDQLFAGDFIYPGMLLAFLPGGHIGRYLATASMLSATLQPETTVLPAHGDFDAVSWKTPRMTMQDIVDLKSALERERETGFPARLIPRQLEVNSQVIMPLPFPWKSDWAAD